MSATRPGRSRPDVSVVLISYNDVARLPRAIRSLQGQTLRNIEVIVVDDASTDDTAAVVERMAATDSRIRYERLERNSGGCSAPRNRGIDLAQAPWVMFCDSDDEYERHACKNLLEAAERTGADVVCGTAERVDVRTGRARRWRPDLHDVERVADGLADLPDLLYDTISVNKIYRRDLLASTGVRFPEGLLFEDQLFTLEVMAASPRVAVIPETVYRWYVDRLSDEPSITQRRSEAGNVESRIEINRRIDAFLDANGLDRVRAVKDLKFLEHDLYLYLASMLELDDETATALMERLRPYVAEANLAPAWQVRTALRVAIYHLLVGDLDGIRSAMRFVKWASVVDVPIVERDGTELWGCPHSESGPSAGGVDARTWLDVSDLGLLRIPFTERRYLHRIESFEVRGESVIATGSSFDYDGSLAEVAEIELRLLINGDRTALSVPTGWTGWAGPRRLWRAEGRPSDHLARALRERDRGTVGIALVAGGLTNVTSARSAESEVATGTLPFPGRARWTGPDSVQLIPYDNGAVGWRARRESATRGRLDRLRATWFRLPGSTRLATVWALVLRDWLPALAAGLGHVLPKRRVILLEADGGRGFSGAVASVGRAMAASEPGASLVWVYRTEPSRVPSTAQAVERGSVRHAWIQSRAAVIVTDGGQPLAFRAPARAVVVNAGAEVPVHRIALDDPSVLVSRAAVATVRRRAREWNLLVAPSDAAADVIREAFGYHGTVVPAGLPGMDAALHEVALDGRSALRSALDLPADRAVILHVVAQRPEGVEEPLIDPEQWAGRLGRRAYLVVHGGPPTPTRLRSSVRDLAADADLSAVIAACDLVISDYSPRIGDAVLADRPVILFQPDREMYVNRTRGLYPGMSAVGPVLESPESLLDEVARWLDDPGAWDLPHVQARQAWATRWCGPVDGLATERVLAAVRAAEEAR